MRDTVWIHADGASTDYASDEQPDWDVAIAASREAVRMEGDDREACGWVEKQDGKRPRIVLVENISREPGTFDMLAEDCMEIYEAMANEACLGIWHSHPSGHRDPSTRDWANHPHGIPMYIVALDTPSEALVMRYDDDDRPT